MDGYTQSAAWAGPYPLQSLLTQGSSSAGQGITDAVLDDRYLLGDGIGQDYAPQGGFSLDDLLYADDDLNGPSCPADLDFEDDDDDDDEDRKAAVKAAMMGLATENQRSPSVPQDVAPDPVKLKTEDDDSHNREDGGDCHSPSAPPSSSDEHFEPLELMRDKPGVAGLAIRGQNNAEKPVYVNPRQYERIAQRRVARARLEEMGRLSRERKPYIHESRHKHAVRRPRGPRGRFLTKDELAQREAQSGHTPGETPSAESVCQ